MNKQLSYPLRLQKSKDKTFNPAPNLSLPNTTRVVGQEFKKNSYLAGV
jgi:hypothetical protein